MILEREAYRRGDRARRHMVRPTEGRQEIKEHFLVCKIDDRHRRRQRCADRPSEIPLSIHFSLGTRIVYFSRLRMPIP